MIKLNSQLIKPTIFPDGTSQVWQIDIPNRELTITWEFKSEDELIHLGQLKDLLDSKNLDVTLKILYLPYGRQDKEVSNTTTFALRTFAKLLNSLNFKKIHIQDPHSDLALKLINNSQKYIDEWSIEEALETLSPAVICFPDVGACLRYGSLQALIQLPQVYCSKVRDQQTGEILDLSVSDNINLKGKSVLIYDDICDGGATFIKLSKKLYALGASDVSLYVTHGLFTKGIDVLRDAGIWKIFTSKGKVV